MKLLNEPSLGDVKCPLVYAACTVIVLRCSYLSPVLQFCGIYDVMSGDRKDQSFLWSVRKLRLRISTWRTSQETEHIMKVNCSHHGKPTIAEEYKHLLYMAVNSQDANLTYSEYAFFLFCVLVATYKGEHKKWMNMAL